MIKNKKAANAALNVNLYSVLLSDINANAKINTHNKEVPSATVAPFQSPDAVMSAFPLAYAKLKTTSPKPVRIKINFLTEPEI